MEGGDQTIDAKRVIPRHRRLALRGLWACVISLHVAGASTTTDQCQLALLKTSPLCYNVNRRVFRVFSICVSACACEKKCVYVSDSCLVTARRHRSALYWAFSAHPTQP
jgi:hypothetical protein